VHNGANARPLFPFAVSRQQVIVGTNDKLDEKDAATDGVVLEEIGRRSAIKKCTPLWSKD